MPPASQTIDKHLADQLTKHPTRWAVLLLLLWFGLNVLVLATTVILEFAKSGKNIPWWEPFCWEISSQVVLLLLIPIGVRINDGWIAHRPAATRLLLHLLLTLPFSAIHIAGMVGIRQIWYQLMGSDYHFGHWGWEFLYEYRKDAQSYFTLGLIIAGYRLMVRRLQGEASYLAEGDNPEIPEPDSTPERLLIKKLGREFLILVVDIEWIEASGNYANLHLKSSVYPMRITMDKLAKQLPPQFIRIHRSTIVNLGQIQDVQALDSGDHQVTLKNQTALVLSRRYREEFKERFTLV